MLQEAKDLQRRAVEALLTKIETAGDKLTFRAPTGSGKTRMMADFMNRVLAKHSDVVFLVSTLSKGGLAEQNYSMFKECADNDTFPNLNPYLINTNVSGEETLFVPTEYNVYVLPRDLNKKNGLLSRGPLGKFLLIMTDAHYEWGLKKKIWLIKDECHVATNNLDDLSAKFCSKVINFSATPDPKRGQIPDVMITDEEAVDACLIKRTVFDENPNVPVDAAIDKLLEIKADYSNLLHTNPCLIIQISNKDKAAQEWEQQIKPAIDKHQELKWMYIVDKDDKCDTNDDARRHKSARQWKNYAKEQNSLIDIIVFKLSISEGWDIPRACMLYQVRNTKSKQLDEQVVGRVRRNPRLLDYETLPEKAQELAMTAWVWGIRPESLPRTRQVTLWETKQKEIRSGLKVTTTKLSGLSEKKGFDYAKIVESKPAPVAHKSIFTLWDKLTKSTGEVQDLCFEYAGGNVQRWWRFMESIDAVSKAYDDYICNYDESIEMDKEVSFPRSSSYMETDQSKQIDTWVWCRKDGSRSQFTFDSQAERQWADILKECESAMARVENNDLFNGETHYLWGKNFPASSEIKYQYYLHGIHNSFPDFVMKDKFGRIHIFEVKNVNRSKAGGMIDKGEYEEKIAALKDFYKHCSAKLRNHIFYLPILKEDGWDIYRYIAGRGETISVKTFKESLEKEVL